ncbi:hypothetical protein N0V83_002881 [Neocucurbitaria cava]|uniref:Uncharacterized protein n=1 Tax=Neocucurbitaria cava TaxID=798079 RepID=A0A9W8YFA5_9PLEO|nr:hypothetical protein N0V83_002881 [Neocucurbitaria cava]
MPCLPINYENLASASTTYDPSKPIYMLNLWKFKPTASYAPEHSALAGAPCTGKEALARYRAALRPLLPPNTAIFFASTPVTEVVAPKGETWDYAGINRYDSLEGFKKMVECEEYKKEAEPHRLAGLEDFRLIVLDKLEV